MVRGRFDGIELAYKELGLRLDAGNDNIPLTDTASG